ncbi:hypothetical protein BDD12DRAFT_348587 [Trichophaea hybrida]|nr:hypothetical protein BDD12DRAFT_348587 [Trichophaea hybrida]
MKLCKSIPGQFALPHPIPCSNIYLNRPKVAATCVGSGAAVKRTPKSCQIRTQIHAIRSCGRSRFRLWWKIFAAGAYFPILSDDFCRAVTVLRHEPGLDRTLGITSYILAGCDIGEHLDWRPRFGRRQPYPLVREVECLIVYGHKPMPHTTSLELPKTKSLEEPW